MRKYDVDGEYVPAQPSKDGVSEHWIPDDNVEALLARLKKLSDKSVKLGGDPLKITVTGEKRFDEKSPSTALPYTKIILEGTAPKLAGWTFLARLEHTKSGNIVYPVPGLQVPKEFISAPSQCDHCSAQRQRKYTYLVKNESGEIAQVGSSCLADFLGHKSPEEIAWLAEYLTEIEREIAEQSSGGTPLISVEEILNMTAAVIGLHGWTSSKAAQAYAEKSGGERTISSTSSRVTEQLWPPTDKESRRLFVKIDVTDADRLVAATARHWAATIDPQGDNYLSNLHVIANEDYIKSRGFGIAVSMIAAHKRAIEGVEKRERQQSEWAKKKEASQWIGSVGERMDFKLTVEKVIPKEGDFGMTYITKLVDEAGNYFTWFASNELTVGQTYELKATIKKHDEYEGLKQTVITRGKIKEAEKDPNDPNSYDHDQWGYRVKYTRKYGEVRIETKDKQLIKDVVDGDKWVFLEYVTPPKVDNPPMRDLAEEENVDLRFIGE